MLQYRDGRAEVHKVVVGPLRTNVYVLRCAETGRAVLLDAADEPEALLELAGGLGVERVLETHGHHDHVGAVPAMKAAGYPVGIAAADAGMVAGHDFEVADGDVFEVGRLRLRAIATPGHTPGSTSYLVEDAPLLFSGDTLFPGGPGATRSPAAFAAIVDSIERRLFAQLGDDTAVLPGHGEATTIGAERPHLAEWVARGW